LGKVVVAVLEGDLGAGDLDLVLLTGVGEALGDLGGGGAGGLLELALVVVDEDEEEEEEVSLLLLSALDCLLWTGDGLPEELPRLSLVPSVDSSSYSTSSCSLSAAEGRLIDLLAGETLVWDVLSELILLMYEEEDDDDDEDDEGEVEVGEDEVEEDSEACLV
jgi:hypothetical protein